MLTTFNITQQRIMLFANNGTKFDIPFLFSKMEYYNAIPKLCFMFHLDTLALDKSVFSEISLLPNFKLKLYIRLLQESCWLILA